MLKGSDAAKHSPQKYSQRIISLKKDNLSRFSKINISSDQIKQTYAYTISGFAAKLSDSQLLSLRGDSQVKSIEQDYMLTLKPDLSILKGKPGSGGGGSTPAEITPWGITRVIGAHDGTRKRLGLSIQVLI